jgi:hypothetical protein
MCRAKGAAPFELKITPLAQLCVLPLIIFGEKVLIGFAQNLDALMA